MKEGDAVKWKYGNGYGTVQSTFTERTVRTIDGKEVVRHGSDDDPAVHVKADDGNNVLKLASELEKD